MRQPQADNTNVHILKDAIKTAEMDIEDALQEMHRYVNHIQDAIKNPYPNDNRQRTHQKEHQALERHLISFQLKKMTHLFDALHDAIMQYHRMTDGEANPYQGVEYRRLSALITRHSKPLSRAKERAHLIALSRQFLRYQKHLKKQNR